MTHPCNTPSNTTESTERRKPFNSKELSALTQRVLRNQQINTYLGFDQSRASRIAIEVSRSEELFTQHVGRVIALNPKQKDSIANLMASALDQKNKMLGLVPDAFTTPGQVRYDLTQAARVSDGILQTQGKGHTLRLLNDLDDALTSVLRKNGIRGVDRGELTYSLLESGYTVKNANIYGNTPNLISELASRRNAMINNLNRIGITNQDDITLLLSKAEDVSVGFETTVEILKTLDPDTKASFVSGWVPKEFTFDFDIRSKDYPDMRAALQDSKVTWKYTPADLSFLSQLAGIKPDEMTELLTDGVKFRNFLIDKFDTDQLDLLTDSGVLLKMPMTSPEVFEYFVKSYNLPYKELNELFIQDPKKAFSAFVDRLSTDVRNSGMIKLIERDGLTQGWASPTKVAEDFVSLNTIAPEFADKTLFVHPTVAKQLKGLLYLSKSPAELGNLAKAWMMFGDILRKSYIGSANALYVGRQFLTNAVSLHAMGADLTGYPGAVADVIKLTSRGLDAFDNVEPYRRMGGKVLTKREFIRSMMIERGVSFEEFGKRLTKPKSLVNPKNVGRYLNYAWTYANAFGAPTDTGWRAGKYVANVLGEGLNSWYQTWGGLAGVADLAARLTAYKSLSELPEGLGFYTHRFVQQATTGMSVRFDNFTGLGKYVDDYLPMFDDIGTVTAFSGRYIRPFSSWMMKSFPMVLRHMVRHPARYYNWVRLMQMTSEDNLEGKDEPVKGEFNAYDMDENPIVLYRDPFEKLTVILTPTNFDPITGAVTSVGKALAGTKDDWQTELYRFLGTTYAGPLLEAVTGIDPFTGRKPVDRKDNTYVGAQMPTWLEGLLSLVPFVDAIDRMNPAGSLGLKAVKDVRTGEVIRPERLSIFNQRRDRNDPTIGDLADQNWGMKMLRAMGFRIRTSNGLVNMGYTYKDIEYTANNLKRTLMSRDFNHPDALQMVDTWVQLEIDRVRIGTWLKQNGVNEIERGTPGVESMPITTRTLEEVLLDGDKLRKRVEGRNRVRNERGD